jgi:hypothetical protein
MTAPFIRITDTHGWIGRIGWWNTVDHSSLPQILPGMPEFRIWGRAPIFTPGWGPRSADISRKPEP